MRVPLIAIGLATWTLGPIAAGQEGIQFSRRESLVGDVMRQSVEFRLQMALEYAHSGQATPPESTVLTRRQSRILEVRSLPFSVAMGSSCACRLYLHCPAEAS